MEDGLKRLQRAELALFNQFAAVCARHHIVYFALGGTLLGALRHGGFIPWDDDMDLGLPRPDYERFLALAREEDLGFQVRTYQTDPTYYRYFARLEDPSVQVVRTDNLTREQTGAWIDLFPLDGMPGGRVPRAVWARYLLWRRAAYKLSCFSLGVNVDKPGRPLAERLLIRAGQVLPVERMFHTRRQLDKLDRALRRFSYETSPWLINLMGAWKLRELFAKSRYGSGRWYPFEDTRIWGPADGDFICTQLYGDYRTPPPLADRNRHQVQVLDPEGREDG